MLLAFPCGMFTKRRGNDMGNIVAMIIGFIVVAILSGLSTASPAVGGKCYTQPSWLPGWNFHGGFASAQSSRFPIAILFRTGADNSSPARTE